MNRIFKLQNAIQPYAWGSHTAIAELLGHPVPSENPEAELWMGAHPKAPSTLWYQGRHQSLDTLIDEDPEGFLGGEVIGRFGPTLPFLLKVLAVERPLSIQAHPSAEKAKAGFDAENAEGIPLSAANRNYRDDRHKPECLCALTPFEALCGFRPVRTALDLFDAVWPDGRRSDLDLIKNGDPNDPLRRFFVKLMQMDNEKCKSLVDETTANARELVDQDPAYEWIATLNRAYPGDIGVLSPVLLNYVCLQPGQALFLPAGRLHAYLNGVAIEVMANSDNVLRGGLTPKHVDVPQLLQILDFKPYELQVLEPEAISEQELFYPSEADEFKLSVLQPQTTQPFTCGPRQASPAILLCVDGKAQIEWEGSTKTLDIQKGDSVLVPADVSKYTIYGEATLYRAGVNI